MKPARYHPAARDELRAAIRYGEADRPGRGAQLEAAVSRVLRRLVRFPESAPRWPRLQRPLEVRRAVVNVTRTSWSTSSCLTISSSSRLRTPASGPVTGIGESQISRRDGSPPRRGSGSCSPWDARPSGKRALDQARTGLNLRARLLAQVEAPVTPRASMRVDDRSASASPGAPDHAMSGSANLTQQAWWQNIECGLWLTEDELEEQGLDDALVQHRRARALHA